jgi:hypothetical protein
VILSELTVYYKHYLRGNFYNGVFRLKNKLGLLFRVNAKILLTRLYSTSIKKILDNTGNMQLNTYAKLQLQVTQATTFRRTNKAPRQASVKMNLSHLIKLVRISVK